MRRHLIASAATVAMFAVVGGSGFAVAQDQGVDTSGNAQGENPPTTANPPAAGAESSSEKLPEVRVIQQQNKAKAKRPKQAQKPKSPSPVVAAPPPPMDDVPEQVSDTAVGEPGLVNMSPLSGSAIPVEKVPGSVSQVSATDFKRDETVIPQEALQSRVPGVIVGDLQGNQFQTNVQYRGFESSPVNGVAQGLAVYQNGVRINEAFGDTVNWDFLPSNAINDITVMTGNPLFGLNAIGGAIAINMKDGFTYHGAEVDTRFGSFGRKQVSTQAGYQSGNFGIYGAFEGINDDGFRDFSDSEIRRGYADLGFKNAWSEFHFSFTGADNHVGVTAAAPEELLSQRGWDRTFTSPQTSDNKLQLYQLNGRVQATSTLEISGNAYYRKFKQKHDDGNIAEAEECDDNPGLLCIEDGVAFARGPGVNSDGTVNFDPDALYGSIDRTSQNADSWGVALQATDKSRLFGYRNQFTIGTSYDHGRVGYTANSELGTFLPRFVVAGTGVHFQAPPDPCPPEYVVDGECGSDDVAPRDLTTTNDYFGAYFTNTTDLTDRLALTVGGRFNYARIEIKDNTGNEELSFLNGTNTYKRFNPMAGLTYELAPGLSLYGGYSEANRAATPAEIACSDPDHPCIIESFLTADPPLKQVVSRTWELGVRGQNKLGWKGDRIDWSVGAFHTLNSNDILSVADETSNGRGYFLNAGDTLRQGIEASIAYRSERLFAYANYTYVDATFRDYLSLSSPDNPLAGECPEGDGGGDDDDDEAHCVQVRPGNRLPGTPQHRFKVGFDYWMTQKWKVGADLLAVSDQFFTGDEGNQDRPLPGFARLNLHTSYNITDNIQIYGLFENLTDNRYGIYGAYFNAEAANIGGEADTPPIEFDEDGSHRSITPAIPFAAYGGIKVKF